MIMNLVILEEDLKKFQKKMTSLNKKLQKYDSEIRVISHKKGFQLLETATVNVNFPVVEYFLEIPETNGKENVEFLGTLSYNSGVPMIYSNTDRYDIHKLYKKGSVCDHCHTSRDRKKWFFFEDEGQIKQIGSTCVLEYFGIPLEGILGAFEAETKALRINETTLDFSDLDEEERELLRNRFFTSNSYISVKEVLGILSSVTNDFSRNWEKGEEGTSSLVKNIIFSVGNREEIRKDIQRNSKNVEKQIETIKKFWDIKKGYTNDFEFNIFSNLYSNSEFNMKVPSKNLGIVCWAFWKALNMAIKDSLVKEDKNNSEFLGEIKDKITITGNIKLINSFNTNYGYGQDGITYLYQIETERGLAKWFSSKDLSEEMASKDLEKKGEFDYQELVEKMIAYNEKLKNEGMDVTLKGTIKNLEIFKEQKQTVLTRCKILVY
jgi:hypothetical protein